MSDTFTKLDTEILKSLEDSTLFYPCSGRDFIVPVTMFAPYIKDFWFVDTAYKRNMPHALRLESGYKLMGEPLIDEHIVSEELWRSDSMYGQTPPFIKTETYLHLETNQTIRVHLHKRRGPTALRSSIKDLGVFFYRGCYHEGASTEWLTVRSCDIRRKRKKEIHEVVDKLINGGLLVTDGSRCIGSKNPYCELARFHSDDTIGEKAVEIVNSFEDTEGRKFHCIGYAGEKYGPTLVWQVTKSS